MYILLLPSYNSVGVVPLPESPDLRSIIVVEESLPVPLSCTFRVTVL